MITYVTISSSQTLQDSPQISYAVFGLLPEKVFTGLCLPCLDLQTFPSAHIWQLFSVYNFFMYVQENFCVLGLFTSYFFTILFVMDNFNFNRFLWVFITGLFVPRLGGLAANIPQAHLR